MAIELVREYLKAYGRDQDIIELDTSSATVELAAQALGTGPERIAKTLSFMGRDHALLVVCAGDCTLAAFLHKWYRDRDNVEEAMKLAMATGANVAESVGIGDFGHVDEYSKRVAVRKLDRQ